MIHHKIHHHIKQLHHHIKHIHYHVRKHYDRFRFIKKHLFPVLSLLLIVLVVIGTLILNIGIHFRQKAENTECTRGISDISIKLNDITPLSNNGNVYQNVFYCFLSVNENVYQADKHNICGIKINNAWPINCPWDSGTTQIIENGVIKTRFTCTLPSSLQAGDRLQIVASRLAGECAQAINWNESSQYVNGPLLYYQSTTPKLPSPTLTPIPPSNPPSGGAGASDCPGTPSVPTNLQPNTTISTDDTITLRWNASNGALRYAIRIDDQGTNGEDGWNYGQNCQLNPPTHLTDICRADIFTNSYSYKVERGHRYAWWVHAINTKDDSACTKWSEAGTAVIVDVPYPSNTPTPTLTPIPTNTPTPSSSPTPTPTLTSTPTPTLTPTPIGGKQLSFNMKLKFQGITKKPVNVANRMVVKITFLTSDFTLETTPEFSSDDNGIWNSQFTVTIPTQKDLLYKILIKGPRHLQRKICVENPQDTVAGRYLCSGDGFRLQVSNTFDFSNIYQYAGDVPPQSGFLDSTDIALTVYGDIGKKDSDSLYYSDMNMDGFVDSQDYSLLFSNLSAGIREDEK
ncbi:hypothetical protein COY87_02600 [Candidatus Roizmanbacteria bacterium CG_4_10_14_0_8_um_filter_33_9]|uniref:Uncharacterized protein n=1 Tax=Candidatus Roizmanbacteria bacterium CG_4_10_14_0_8_um_filter_33_9 TaxID=1974826 RepID=A0A2M7QJH1_9BACT|nr:MAG: hypothetical protein COY87_02600 [Candidatus Roizmanbacteria bacterium CG_4_10_14_0_8_um_filter_33_9]